MTLEFEQKDAEFQAALEGKDCELESNRGDLERVQE